MSTSVHPTALVDPKCELDDQVEVGPYSIIGSAVRIEKGTDSLPGANSAALVFQGFLELADETDVELPVQ